jgi:hypothetical protein
MVPNRTNLFVESVGKRPWNRNKCSKCAGERELGPFAKCVVVLLAGVEFVALTQSRDCPRVVT